MSRGVIFLVLISVLLVISSCVPSDSEGSVIPTGLGMEFVNGYPEDSLIENDLFNVKLEVTNELPYSVVYSLCVRGDIADFYGGVPRSEICKEGQSLEASYKSSNGVVVPIKRTVTFPEEDQTFSYFNLDKSVRGTKIVATLSYDISKDSEVDICILDSKDSEIRGGDKACLAEENIISGIKQEPAPLVISRIEKEVKNIGGTPQIIVRVYLDKVSDGGNIRKDYDFEGDLVGIGLSMRGTATDFSCVGEVDDGKVKFEQGKPIECKSSINVENGNVYKDSLIINLNYGYELGKDKDVSFS